MIRTRYSSALSGLLITLTFAACAQTKKKTATGSAGSYATLLQATSQRTLPGLPGSAPYTDYRFVIVWKHTTPPESFFWRGEDGWTSCYINKAGKRGKANSRTGVQDYDIKAVQTSNIRKGDTLQIMPVRGGKDAVPEAIPQTVTNTLFFKTANTAWLQLPVTNIKELPKVIAQ